MREILEYLKKYKKEACYTAVVSLVIAFLSATMPFLYGKMLDIVIKTGTYRDREIYVLFAAGLLIITATNLLNRYQFRKKNNIAINCEKDLVVDATGYLLKLPADYHKNNGSGEIFEKISRAGYYLNNLISQVIFLMLPDVATIAVMVAILSYISLKLTAFVLTIIILFILITLKKANDLVGKEKAVRSTYENTYRIMSDSVDNIVTIKSCTTEDMEKQKYEAEYQKIASAYDRLIDTWSNIQLYQASITGKGSFICFGLALIALAENEMTAGQVLMAVGYLNLIYRPLAVLSGNYVVIKKSLVSIERVNELLKEPIEPYDKGLVPDKITGRIEFNNVTYGNNGCDQEVLRDISFVAEPGKILGIVGRSGTGKTTIKDLILRFKNGHKNGEILVDGIRIDELNLLWLRSNIALVSQDIKLFNDTIKYNACYGLSEITPNDLMWAAKMSGAEEFIERFSGKYEHRVGKHGLNLSTGERQRLAILQAIVKKSRVIIMDEAVSNLDSITAEKILKSLKSVFEDKTVIFITHQYSTLKNADEILVLGEHGELAERGTHEELINKKGYYSKLCELQNCN